MTLVRLAQIVRNLWLGGYSELEVLKGVSEMRDRPAGAGTMAQDTYRRLEAKRQKAMLEGKYYWRPHASRDR